MKEQQLQEIEARCRAAHDVGECGSREESVFHAHATGDVLALIAALREAWKDKERFDWLDDTYLSVDAWLKFHGANDIRSALDAARKAEQV